MSGSVARVRPAPPQDSFSARCFHKTGHRTVLVTILLLCVVRLWLMPLKSSFWVDEMGTVFVVRHGAGDPSLSAAPQVPASVYYVLPRAAERILGTSEIAYRIPSVVAMAGALYLVARIAARLIHHDAGWIAAFACLALSGFNYQAADARPYALGTLAAAAAIWFLIAWLDTGAWRHAAGFVTAASLLWRVHLIFWPVYAAFGIYAVVRLLRRDTKAGWAQTAIAFTVLGLTLIPVAITALSIYGNAGAHVVTPSPSGSDLVSSLKLGLITSFCAGSAILSRVWECQKPTHGPSASDITLIGAWWLAQPVLLFAFSLATGDSVFVSRYLFIALPGAALAATAVAGVFLPSGYWRTPAVFLGLAVLAAGGRWNRIWPAHHGSDWRAAAQTLNQELHGAPVPVLCPSPFIEAVPPVWRPDYPASGFLYSHLAFYAVRGRIYPFPFTSSGEAERFAGSLARNVLLPSGRFAIYGGARSVRWWCDWFAARPELGGWRQRGLGDFGDVEALLFERGEAQVTAPAAGALPLSPAFQWHPAAQ